MGRSSEKALEAKTAIMIAAGRQRSVKLRLEFNLLKDPKMLKRDMRTVTIITMSWMRKFPTLYEPYAHLETSKKPVFSREWSTMRNQSSAFSSPLSTPLMVRKGRGSQKEETR